MKMENLKGSDRFADVGVDIEETCCEDVDWIRLAQDIAEQWGL
jgi:hypothetical protein